MSLKEEKERGANNFLFLLCIKVASRARARSDYSNADSRFACIARVTARSLLDK